MEAATMNRIEDAELLRLKDQEGLSYRELGALCGISHVAVRKRYLRLKGVNSGDDEAELPPEAGAGNLTKVDIEKKQAEVGNVLSNVVVSNEQAARLLAKVSISEAVSKIVGESLSCALSETNKTLKNTKSEEYRTDGNRVTKRNLDLQEIRYLKKLDTPDWNYHVATPALLEKVRKGEMLPYDPVTKRYFISVHDINKLQNQARFEALLTSGSITVLGGNSCA